MKTFKTILGLCILSILVACEKPADPSNGGNPAAGSLEAFRNDIGKWGFKKGSKEVIKPQYDGVMPFQDGVTRVRVGKKFGFIDESGKYLIEPTYVAAEPFREGLAPVQAEEDGKWGFIDKTGKYVLEAKYDTADTFSDGFAVVDLNGKSGYIDIKGVFKEGEVPGTEVSEER